MKRRVLGRTGLDVSEIGCGTVELGVEYGIQVDGKANKPQTSEAVRIVQRVLDRGVNVIDTAAAYGDSERIIGLALQGQRDSVVLMTKVGPIRSEWDSEELRRFMDDSLEASLRTLRTDVIDVYQIHSAPLAMIERGDVIENLDRYRKAGKVRFLGATIYRADEALAVLGDSRIDVIQVPYSILDASMEDRVISLAAKQGVGVVARSVLHRGVLTPKGASGSKDERRLHATANGFEFLFDDQTQSLPHAAVRFVLSNSGIGCALLGMDSVEQVDENLSYGDILPFDKEQLRQVRERAPDNPWSVLPAESRSRKE